jgi:putative PIN family toxin of toxin-antitoxin system
MAEKKKVVPDTGFILQATLNPSGPANAALQVLETGEYEICLSPQVREEIEDVLNRPSIRAKYPKLGDGRAEAMLQRLDGLVRLVTVIRTYMEFPRDPNDEPILNLAIQEQADYIIARDKDLFDLSKGKDFRLLYPYLHVVDPVTFLQTLLAEQPPEQTANSQSTLSHKDVTE